MCLPLVASRERWRGKKEVRERRGLRELRRPGTHYFRLELEREKRSSWPHKRDQDAEGGRRRGAFELFFV